MDPTVRDALLRAVREAPEDDAPRLILADWLDEHADPTPVRLGRCPGWLRDAVQQANRRHTARRQELVRARLLPTAGAGGGPAAGFVRRPAADDGGGPPVLPLADTTAGAVLQALAHPPAWLGLRPALDHYGTAQVAGVPDCFVSEPYAPFPAALRSFDGLAGLTGGIPAACRQAHRGAGCVRVVLFPPGTLRPGDGIGRHSSRAIPMPERRGPWREVGT